MSVVLWVLLGLVLLLFLLAAVLLLTRVGIEAVGATGEVIVELRYGALRVPLFPPPKHIARPQKRKDTPRSASAPKFRYTIDRSAVDWGELLDLLLTLLGELSDRVRISRLRVRVLIGTDDAAQTGILLGQSAAVTGMIVPFLENTFEMQDYRVSVDADFEADHTEWAFTVLCSARPVQLLWVMLRHGKALFRLYKRLVKKEAIKNE